MEIDLWYSVQYLDNILLFVLTVYRKNIKIEIIEF